MNKAMLAALLAVSTITVQAATVQDLEASTVVNGTIVVNKDGSVLSASIDDAAKYGQPVADMVRNAALHWRFQPVLRDGAPVVAKASMHTRVIVKKMPGGDFSARIKGATFGDYDQKSTDALQVADHSTDPHYPEAAIHNRVQGTVYLALHVDRRGHVIDAAAVQVNLDNIGNERDLGRFRQLFADACLKAVRQWTYHIPTTGPLAKQDSWTADFPINFNLRDMASAETAPVWEAYAPGPYTPAPWVDKPDMNANDAVADNSVRTEGIGLKLLSQIHHD